VQTAPNPYSSFSTPYTPGYGIAPAGYGTYATVQTGGSILPWLLGAGLLLLVMRGRA